MTSRRSRPPAGARGAAFIAAVLITATAPSTATASRPYPGAPVYQVGIAKRSIAPDADGTWKGGTVNLGGYGLGGPPLFEGRPATGVLGAGPDVRAIVVRHGDGVVAIADEQTQGWFAALKGESNGLEDIRKEVERRSGGDIPAESVVVQSDHTHGGPDMMGVWGGVPEAYRHYAFEQTVRAILAADRAARPGVLLYGTAPGADLLSNQFSYDPNNQAVDSDVRVLQAVDPRTGDPFATMLNFSAHATVLGSSNTSATGDWPQRAGPMLERRYGGHAMVTVGTLGRTQPSDRGCPDDSLDGDAESLCSLDEYAGRVVDRAAVALRHARPIRGPAVVAARSYLITDVATNALLLGFEYAGAPAGTPLNRSDHSPWFTGNVLGTVTSSARIGDLLISAFPGEAYPQIALGVESAAQGIRDQLTLGLADDQLGYLIAPGSAYPEPIRRSFFNERGDEISPIDNDNYFFNVSMTIGERVWCSSLRGAGELFGAGTGYRDGNPDCAQFANDARLPHGADLTR